MSAGWQVRDVVRTVVNVILTRYSRRSKGMLKPSAKLISRRRFVATSAAGAALASTPLFSQAAGSSSQESPDLRPQTSSQPYPGHGPEASTSVSNVRRTARDLVWRNVSDWGVEGKAWNDTERYFDRLPSRTKNVVPEPVWNLSRHSSGMCARFETDSQSIHVRYRLLNDNLAMPHMPATGVSGVDLYAEDAQGVDRWVAVVQPRAQDVEAALAENLLPGLRTYTLHLPLYNGLDSLEIGIDADAAFTPISPRKEKPIVFYGTSIMQGACASRPGMAIPAILGRRLHLPVVNLGFSGNGRMESALAELLGELDPCLFAIDCVPNMTVPMIEERTIPLVRILKRARPDTPVLLVEDRAFSNTPFFPSRGAQHRANRKALREAFETLTNDGVTDLYYLAGDYLLGEDGEGATDGSHPSDLGMVRYADAYEPVLRTMLRRY